MGKFLILLLALFVMACSSPEKQMPHNDLWAFEGSKNDPQVDALLSPIFADYEGMLKSMANNDTSSMFSIAKSLILRCDTLPRLIQIKDTALQNSLQLGLMNFEDELQGLVLEQYSNDIHVSINMATIQLLHLLGTVGYKKQTVYIYNTIDNNTKSEEDGLIWLALTKKSNNPYYSIGNEIVNAISILQEN